LSVTRPSETTTATLPGSARTSGAVALTGVVAFGIMLPFQLALSER